MHVCAYMCALYWEDVHGHTVSLKRECYADSIPAEMYRREFTIEGVA